MAMNVGGGGTALAEINVTPLVDVMLVLLIVFMVAAPMLQTGVDVNLPDAKAQTMPDDQGKVVVSIKKTGEVFIGKMAIPLDKVEETLKNNARLQSDGEAYLHADEDLRYGEILKLMAVMQMAGVKRLGMVADPLK